MKYFLKVFGCQMNQSDAERISAILEKCKLKKASSIDEASFIVFITCGVRQSAEDRVYGQINNIRKKYPKKRIILTGCLAHRKDVQRRLRGKVALFSTINDFPKLILPVIARSEATKQSQAIQKRTGLLHYACNDKGDYFHTIPKYSIKHTAFVPIMTGCDNFCAYCVVPHARGREYSRPVDDILKEVKSLARKGYKEIVLLGQNVNSYTSSLPPQSPKSPQINFPHLLRLIEKIPGKFWLTFLTSHPKDMSDELIEVISKSKKICEYISLPVQSGDNEILRKMNRHYTIEHYKNLIKILKLSFRKSESLALGKLPPAISTDIIVGFPGETKKQFENTAKLLREMKFDMVFIAQYSPRPETLAWKLKDNVSRVEKARREKVLTEILAKTALENNKKYAGKVVEVLVDRDLSSLRKQGSRKKEPLDSRFRGNDNEENNMRYQGHTKTQKKVIFHSNKKIPIGRFVKVKITKAKAFGLEGKII